jgi:urea transport system ATP-binding protein
MLSIHGLNQFYGGSHILWDIDLEVPSGSVTCLMGRNGMGKTTLLKCVMGLLPAASGAIRPTVPTSSPCSRRSAASRTNCGA